MPDRAEFLRRLKLLLKEFDAEITAEDHWQGYAECGQDIRITVEFSGYLLEDIEFGKSISAEGQTINNGR